jgi:UDPglucose 6-dehydrogenase
VAVAAYREGADVLVHDPQALDNARAAFPELTYTSDVPKVCEDADLVLHLTPWQEYRKLDPASLAEVVRTTVLLDARNSLDPQPWWSAGWTVSVPGRPLLSPSALPSTSASSDRGGERCMPS